MALEASTSTSSAPLRRTLVWVIAAAAAVEVVVLAIGAHRHWRDVPAIVREVERQLDPRFGAAAESEAHERGEKIRAEIASLGIDHAWAGSYYEGDGLGENVTVTLAPNAGFVFEWEGCTGVYDRNFGTVKAADGRIELSFHFPNTREAYRGLAPELVPIRWGERHYLVALDKMVSFCADVNSGFEPIDGGPGTHLLRTGDEHKPAPGFPEVPEEYRRLLLKVPVEPRVIQVLDSRSQESGLVLTRVTLDAGSNQGVFPGMRMGLIEPHELGWLTVENVIQQTCTAVVKENRSNGLLPKVGWRFTSRYWQH
jgi:hypothetical protein